MKVVDGGIIIMYLMTQNMLVHACDDRGCSDGACDDRGCDDKVGSGKQCSA